MGKDGRKDPLTKARKKVARAQTRYMKAVARGEREIRNVRALADERIARAKAEFELKASELAEVERGASANGANSKVEAVDVIEVVALEVVEPEAPSVVANGATTRRSTPKNGAGTTSAVKRPGSRQKK